MNTTQKMTLQGFLIAGCGLSILVSSWFWSHLGVGVLTKSMLGAMGILFDVTKLLAIPAIVWFLSQRKWLLTGFSTAVYLILALVSVVASIGVLKNQTSQIGQTLHQQTHSYQLLLTQIKQQQASIDALLESQQKDVATGYRQRAHQTQTQVEQEKAKLEQLLGKLESKPEVTQGVLGGLSQVLSQMFHLTAHQINDGLSLLLGALLEISTTFLLLVYVFSKNDLKTVKKKPVDPKLIASDLASSPLDPKKDAKAAIDPDIAQAQDQNKRSKKRDLKYESLKAKILSGEMVPKTREAKQQAGLGSDRVKEYFGKMVAEGILSKKGNRFVLVYS